MNGLILTGGGCVALTIIEKKQQEARFGFYINIKTFLLRLMENKMFFSMKIDEFEHSDDMPLLFFIFQENKICELGENDKVYFKSLCAEMVAFFTNSKDIVPPSCCENHSEWYRHLFVIIKFIQLGQLENKARFSECECSELLAFCENIHKSIRFVDKSIDDELMLPPQGTKKI
jgi:hypothetical protein